MGLVCRILLPCLIVGALGVTMLSCSGHSTPPPAIASSTPSSSPFSPAQAPVNSTIYIFGSGFKGATSVTIGGVLAGFFVNNDSEIQAQVPINAQSGNVVVVTPGGATTSPVAFFVTPTINGISDVTNAALVQAVNPGDAITITGSGFIGATAPLIFYSPAASPVSTPQPTYTVVNANQIKTTVPASTPAGSGYALTVTVPGPSGGTINNIAPYNSLPNPTFSVQ
jgi:hypothetical protein